MSDRSGGNGDASGGGGAAAAAPRSGRKYHLSRIAMGAVKVKAVARTCALCVLCWVLFPW